MRATFVSMCIVMALSLALCFFSTYVQTNAISHLESVRKTAVAAADKGDMERLREALSALSDSFDSRMKSLEYIASHNDLHEVYSFLVDARISLDYGDLDDVGQALAQMGEALEHIREHEKFNLKNLV